MQCDQGNILYSASDLVAFLGCRHRTTLDLRRLDGWDETPVAPDAAMQLVQDYGDRHERAHLATLRNGGGQVIDIDPRQSLDKRVRATRAAMAEGAEVIFQAALFQPPFLGYADFLLRVPGPSTLGDYHYEVADTKLAQSNRAKFMVQLGFYADLLAAEQGVLPARVQVVLGPLDARERQRRGLAAVAGHHVTLPTRDYIHYVRAIQANFRTFVAGAVATQPLPRPACKLCGWRAHCQAQWERMDHPCRVANIRAGQIARLAAQGVTTMTGLAHCDGQVKGIGAGVLDRLKRQAALQCTPFDAAGQRRLDFLDPNPDKPVGFELLPEPDPGDLYFDMEGFPYEPGGLEYLFGVGYLEQGDPSRFTFQPFWAHDRAGEKQAFEAFMDFVAQRLDASPAAHIYHYAPYEKTAIQRLSSLHQTRTDLRDRLLREGRLVDLYRVVASGLLLALPSYSIKQVEVYYGRQHQGEVANAGDSLVQYEAYRSADDAATKARLLQGIADYNRDDVESTWHLHRWLERQRPPNARRFQPPVIDAAAQIELQAKREERDAAEAQARVSLAAWVGRQSSTEQPPARAIADLLIQLRGFYWRCKLPGLWRMYQRREQDEAELLDDQDCLALLKFTGNISQEAQSKRYHYRVPEQESKLSTGATVTCLTDAGTAAKFQYDAETQTASFTRGNNGLAPPPVATLCLNDWFDDTPKLDAIDRFIQRLGTGEITDSALLRLLGRQWPRRQGKTQADAVVTEATLSAVLAAIRALETSHLAIQGPPGTGKTTTAAQVIAALLADGQRVGITSNSHAAINHLLKAAYRAALDANTPVRAAVVKAAADLPDGIEVISNDAAAAGGHNLMGGTAWLFCREAQHWDYLFIDEASQVSLADLVAVGSCARNLVLLGDQQQLPQPTQGIHPGDSGLSALDFLMRDQATVAANQGIFLDQTYRLHPRVRAPVSQGVYEDRLIPAAHCARHSPLLGAGADPALQPDGIVYLPVPHAHRSQSAPEEAQRIRALYESLLRQSWINRDGVTAPLTPDDILVVAPYNAQVRVLRKTLGESARVGTVDKFQGQEAAVAILSMTTSDADHLPRSLDFLFSKNRLNVAVSRAKCLAVIVASPGLQAVECHQVEEMALLSFYARLTRGSLLPDDLP